jgi:Ni,Fe-hydrogenase maturation factor
VTVLVGGVGQLYQGDLDLGRLAAERLAAEALGPDVLVEELHYGAVAVAQRLEELRPRALVLVGAVARGRRPGTVERRLIRNLHLPPERVQRAVGDAVTGYVTLARPRSRPSQPGPDLPSGSPGRPRWPWR